MTKFLDGPAAGKTCDTRRAPVFLRAVIDGTTGKVDVLDQLDDTPTPSETVSVYERVTMPAFFCVRPGGCFESADYAHMPHIDGELLRETGAWQAWANSEGARRERSAEEARAEDAGDASRHARRRPV